MPQYPFARPVASRCPVWKYSRSGPQENFPADLKWHFGQTRTSSACGLLFTKDLPLFPWLTPTVARFSMRSPIQVLHNSNAALLLETNKMKCIQLRMQKGQKTDVFNQQKIYHSPYRQSKPQIPLSFFSELGIGPSPVLGSEVEWDQTLHETLAIHYFHFWSRRGQS